jgi:hypothetical protein
MRRVVRVVTGPLNRIASNTCNELASIVKVPETMLTPEKC